MLQQLALVQHSCASLATLESALSSSSPEEKYQERNVDSPQQEQQRAQPRPLSFRSGGGEGRAGRTRRASRLPRHSDVAAVR
mmetsp:Transcript_30231/g.69307  ORF Transcript_30231/g.69307 Transcript_30231/m.69307 type:complete len:82 (+) Transcript_30231:776-1021(+)